MALKKHKKHPYLLPLAFIYDAVTSIRNFLYDEGIIRSTQFNIPVISIGNLALGGTGKTPHTEFLISKLSKNWNIAVLSRGYKRKTKGFILANEGSNANMIGDEPYQIFRKFQGIKVAVDEKRVRGITTLTKMFNDIDLIILDDAFQHRAVKPGLSILLTDFANIYVDDWVVPAGRLRESKKGSKRADLIIVSKCPADIKPIDLRLLSTEIKPESKQQLYFSTIQYKEILPVFQNVVNEKKRLYELENGQVEILLVSGIANNQSILDKFQKVKHKLKVLSYRDHHHFGKNDFNKVEEEFNKISSTKKIILITEKDAAKLISNNDYPETLKEVTYILPIGIEILQNQESNLIEKIEHYVRENHRDSKLH